MADIITLVQTQTVKGVALTYTFQPTIESVDVSAYDSLDLQVNVLSVNHSDGVTIAIVSSMQNKDDVDSWLPISTTGVLYSATPLWEPMLVPGSSGTPMFRYVRYRVTFGTNTTMAVLSITGLARRK